MADIKMKIQWFALAFSVAAALILMGCSMDDGKLADSTAAQPCPPWVEFPADRHSNADSPYLGCTNHVNLVNMLESPADLDQGRPLGPGSAERETVVLKDYDQNKSTPFKAINAPSAPPAASGSSGGNGQ